MILALDFPADPTQAFFFDELRTFQAGPCEHKFWAGYGFVVSDVDLVVDEALHKWREFRHRDHCNGLGDVSIGGFCGHRYSLPHCSGRTTSCILLIAVVVRVAAGKFSIAMSGDSKHGNSAMFCFF
jgi:hypothetical protein